MALTYRTVLLALAGVLVVAFLLPSGTGVALVTSAIVLLVLMDVARAGPVRSLRFARSGDAAVRLGETATVELTVTNPSSRSVHGLLRDAWTPSAGAVTQRFSLAVPAQDRQVLRIVLRPTRRGDRLAHRVTVRSLGPLGLAGRQGSHTVPFTVRVLPSFLSSRHLPSRLERLRELDGRAAVRTRGQGTEFDSLREYVDGDDVRSIDWRATARGSSMMVRTWRPERDRHVLIVLDTGRTSAGRVGDVPRLDHLMDATLLLAALATRAGDRVDFLSYDRKQGASVTRPGPAEVLPRLTSAMAPLESVLVEADYRGLASAVFARTRRRSLIVVLTGLDHAVVEAALLPALVPLVKRHVVLVGAVADPAIESLAAGRDSVSAVYGAASAERTRADRLRASGLLERAGITVVDAPPGSIAPELADTYLALKKAGRL